jgi:hypothetical protein
VNPLSPAVRHPVRAAGWLAELLRDFPSLRSDLERVHLDSREDYKDTDYAKKHPYRDGRTIR